MPVDISDVNIKDIELFRDVDEAVAKKFIADGFKFSYNAGTPIVVNDDVGETFFILVTGLAKIALVTGKREEVNVTLLKAGDFFGELTLLQKDPVRTANVVAATDVEVVAVQKKEFLELMKQYPELALNIARVIGGRLRNMNDRLVALTLPDFNRVARTLLYLARQGKAFSEEGPILLPALPLAEWSLFCNIHRDGFLEHMEVLREEGCIAWQNQRIVVTDVPLLVKYAQPPADVKPGESQI